MQLSKIAYSSLNSKQKEIYNFQKVAAQLADYGFNCIKLADDWQGADFLAYHKNGNDTLKVQLKGRLTINKKYLNKNLYLAFPVNQSWCLISHDDLMDFIAQHTGWLKTVSWLEKGIYHASSPNKALQLFLKPYIL